MKRTQMKRSGKPASAVPPITRWAVLSRDGFTCQRFGCPVADGEEFSVHHRKPRKAGGRHGDAAVASYDMSNLVTLCGTGVSRCHGQVEADREQAYADGWLVREHENPANVPCLTYRGWEQPGETWEPV